MWNKSSALSQDPHSDIPIYLYDENESILTINENVCECYDQKDKCSYPWEEYKRKVKNIIISEKITQIPKRAFTNYPKLTTVELPEAIASIEDETFTNCYHLIDINIPMNCTIAPNAFKNCFTLDVLKVLNKLFCSINVNDRNIQHQIANIMSSLKRIDDDNYSKLFMNMKQFYILLKSKENFV